MADRQPEQRVVLPTSDLQWDATVGRGQYTNSFHIFVSEYEVVLDFSFLSAVPHTGGQPPEATHNTHIARIILGHRAAGELRDLLNRYLPAQQET